MILKSLINNPLDRKPKPWKPWYGYLFLVVLVVCGGLYVYERVTGGPLIPTMTVPSQVYENAKAALEHQQQAATSNTEENGAALDAVARAAALAINASATTTTTVPLPSSVDLAVPFITQSPLGTWTDEEREYSEEATYLMVRQYYTAGAKMDETELERIFEAMLYPKLSMKTFAAFIATYDPTLTGTVLENPTVEQIKTSLAQGVPVIVPTDGAALQNPFYVAAGLPYHCIIIRGYDDTQFFVNDPGTRHGEKYAYNQSVVMDAISDWDEEDGIVSKSVLMVTRK